MELPIKYKKLAFGVNNVLNADGNTMEGATLAHRHCIERFCVLDDLVPIKELPGLDVFISLVYAAKQGMRILFDGKVTIPNKLRCRSCGEQVSVDIGL